MATLLAEVSDRAGPKPSREEAERLRAEVRRLPPQNRRPKTLYLSGMPILALFTCIPAGVMASATLHMCDRRRVCSHAVEEACVGKTCSAKDRGRPGESAK